MSRISLLLLVVVFCNACTLRVRQPDPQERELITAEIMALTEQVLAAAERADAQGLFMYHSSGAEFIHINNGERFTREELVAYYQNVYSGVERQEISMGDPAISILSKDAVVVASQGRFKTFRKDGSTLSGDIAWTFLWRRDPNGWKLYHAHQSFPGPIRSTQ